METDKRRYRELREREKRYISNKNKVIERQRQREHRSERKLDVETDERRDRE
jgi:hypothetical protein